ncbi:MAG TPA: PEP-CTERM sorting domain-containing protein [Gemmataceae bacterium]|nr:PEP-CTERM sorting domain-containing protein [Gemmataceae bacterium]
MKRLWVCFGIIIWLLAGRPSTAEAGLLFGADGRGGNPSTLYTINPTTGAATAVGAIQVGNARLAISGLAFDTATNTLYGATAPRQNGGGAPNELVKINTSTGAATPVGFFGVSISDLTFDTKTSTLFGWSGRVGGSSLQSINPATGQATQIGFSNTIAGGAGLAANSAGTLFMVPGSSSGPLDTVNKTTGQATTVANLSGAPSPFNPMFALAFDENDVLFGLNGDFLVTINTSTGAMTSHGEITHNGTPVSAMDAIAFAPQPNVVPEPATLMVSGIGGVGLVWLGAWRRRRQRVA